MPLSGSLFLCDTRSVESCTAGAIRPSITLLRVIHLDRRRLRELACLQDSVFQGRRHNRSELEGIAACPDTSALFLALHGRRIVGFVFARYSKRLDEWIVRGIGVDRPYRRIGIATMLLERAVMLVNVTKGQRLISYVDKKNTPSLRLHKKMGFRVDAKSRLALTELRYRLVSCAA